MRMTKIPFILVVIYLFTLQSCAEITGVEDISEKKISIIVPTQGVKIPVEDVVFLWNPVKEATDYRLQIVRPSFFKATQLLVDTLLKKERFRLKLNKGIYEWRVKASNSVFETDYSMQSFQVIDNK